MSPTQRGARCNGPSHFEKRVWTAGVRFGGVGTSWFAYGSGSIAEIRMRGDILDALPVDGDFASVAKRAQEPDRAQRSTESNTRTFTQLGLLSGMKCFCPAQAPRCLVARRASASFRRSGAGRLVSRPDSRSGGVAKNSARLPVRLVFLSHSSAETVTSAPRPCDGISDPSSRRSSIPGVASTVGQRNVNA